MTLWFLLASFVVAVAGFVLLSGYLKTWLLFRGQRLIICPETHEAAAVRVDAARAAKWAAISGEADLRLDRCTRWPERAGCDQACLTQIESAPVSCRVRTIVASWYSGKCCHYCGEDIGPIVWHERPPALRSPDGTTVEWKDVRVEDLLRLFRTHSAVCWKCHVTESFRREHSSLVVERKRPAETRAPLVPSAAVY